MYLNFFSLVLILNLIEVILSSQIKVDDSFIIPPIANVAGLGLLAPIKIPNSGFNINPSIKCHFVVLVDLNQIYGDPSLTLTPNTVNINFYIYKDGAAIASSRFSSYYTPTMANVPVSSITFSACTSVNSNSQFDVRWSTPLLGTMTLSDRGVITVYPVDSCENGV
jgi:hypothetical protein